MSNEQSDAVTCRSCGADIVFLRTVSGRKMPVNAETVEPGDTDYEQGRHVAHWSTCDKPDQFRKSRR